MALGMSELWTAMKESKFRRVSTDLQHMFDEAENVDDAIEAALKVLVDSIHAEAGTFWFYNRFGDKTIYPRKVCGGADISGFRLKLGEGVAGIVIETGESTIVYDCRRDMRWASKVDKATGFCTSSMICVPVCINEHPFGCVQVLNKTDDDLFDDKDLSFAENLAEMISEQFAQQHLLPEYDSTDLTDGEDDEEETPVASLMFALQENSMKKMEDALFESEWFAKQSPKKQWQIMSHMDELWKLMNKLK